MIAENLSKIVERIEAAAQRAGRRAGEVRLMVVTKTQPRDLVGEAYSAGARLFGENRIGEAEEKYRGFHDDAELHMIGHLQRNKAGRAAALVRCVQSIDKTETAAALEKHCSSAGRSLDLLLEVNTSGEASKEGFHSDEELFTSLEEILAMEHLRPRGLMTVAALTDDKKEIRRCFRRLVALREAVRSRYRLEGFDELSMGMTSDFEIAIEEGSTLVRVGTAVFGPRPSP